jgi:hypothetical protein
MADLDALFESRIRKIAARKIKSPGLKGFKPWRFEAGSNKGGQFAPKGVGSTSYRAISKAIDKPDVRSWNPDAPFEDIDDWGRPEWKPGATPPSASKMRAVARSVSSLPEMPKRDHEWKKAYGDSRFKWTKTDRGHVARVGLQGEWTITKGDGGWNVQGPNRPEPSHTAKSLKDAKLWVDDNIAIYGDGPFGSRLDIPGYVFDSPVSRDDKGPNTRDAYGRIWRVEKRQDPAGDGYYTVTVNGEVHGNYASADARAAQNHMKRQASVAHLEPDEARDVAGEMHGDMLMAYGRGIWRIEDSQSGAMTPENAREALLKDAVFKRLIADIAENPDALRGYTDADGNPTYDGGQRAYVEWYEAPRGRKDPARNSIYTPDKAVFAQALIDGVRERRQMMGEESNNTGPSPNEVARQMLFGRSGSGRAVGAMPIFAFGRDDGMASGNDFLQAAGFSGDASTLRADAQQWLGANPDATGPEADAIRALLNSSQGGRDFLRDVYGRKFGTKTWPGIVSDAREWVSANPGDTSPEAQVIQRLAQNNKNDRGIFKGIAARGLRGGYVVKKG